MGQASGAWAGASGIDLADDDARLLTGLFGDIDLGILGLDELGLGPLRLPAALLAPPGAARAAAAALSGARAARAAAESVQTDFPLCAPPL